MKYFTLLAVMIGASLNTALAVDDVYITGTTVSYNKNYVNDSIVFIDADKGDDFLAFSCNKGRINFYFRADKDIMKQADFDAEKTPAFALSVDGKKSQNFKTVPFSDSSENKLKGFYVSDSDDDVILKLIKSAVQQVNVQFKTDLVSINDTFQVKGLAQALDAINQCR